MGSTSQKITDDFRILSHNGLGSLLLRDRLLLEGVLVGWAVDVVLGVVVFLDLFVLGVDYFLEEVAE